MGGMTRDYYAKKLSAQRLSQAYELAGPRVRQYLRAEIDHLAGLIKPHMRILELGCGYGRVLGQVAHLASEAWGIDNSTDSLTMARAQYPGLHLRQMDAASLDFEDNGFDLVFGVQNFISACKVPPMELLKEALRVTRPGGDLLLSSYAAEFWPHRLEWFQKQAEQGFLGPIDLEASGEGRIICQDGFVATTFSPQEFEELARSCAVRARIYTIDNSAVFCRIAVG
jgi:SAM-dependent methyltransferase